jgi:hypothetical protein
MDRYRITEKASGREVITTDQAVARSDRWKNPATLRAWIARNGIQPAGELNARTKLYYPEDLGLEPER